tara:strand:- start:17345 stop:18439 length:1095 start_codon:yes stop_codon:yes gene_type:complete
MSNYCPEIYKGLFIDRWNDDHIKIAPCCQSIYAKTPTVDFNFKTNKHLQNLRKQFNQGKKPKECHRCWKDEDLGQTSRRQNMIDFFKTKDKTIELSSLDYNVTWACNSACVMCNPWWSSIWAKELDIKKEQLEKIGRYHRATNNSVLDQFDLSKIQKLHFNGGEPLINKDHEQVIEKLYNSQQLANTFISYNTNGTQYPSERTIELWSMAKLIRIYFSIDAIGSAFNYIRYPGKWEQVKDNLQKWRENMPSNVMFGLNVTIGSYNVLEMPDLYEWFKHDFATNREGDTNNFHVQTANNFDPKDLCTKGVERAIMLLKPIDKFQGIINYLKEYKTNNEWTYKLDRIDARRNTNWRKSLKIGEFYD